ncbi:MAG: RNA polymerase sigma factor [Candidatus Omnitrophica bacterium]|nr:RNA polymerase sigma factor [Candidatus Omnitrophota bacterium]
MLSGLIERCIAKDREAWLEFIRRFQDTVTVSIKAKLSRHGFSFSEEDIKDISQSVFIDIWQKEKLLQVRDRNRVRGWLSVVSQNAGIDFMRRNSARSRIYSLLDDSEGPALSEGLPDASHNPADMMEIKDLQHEVSRFISHLPEKHRIVLSLCLLHNQTHREIAAILNIRNASVSSIIARAKKRLRKVLEEKGYSGCK